MQKLDLKSETGNIWLFSAWWFNLTRSAINTFLVFKWRSIRFETYSSFWQIWMAFSGACSHVCMYVTVYIFV